MVALLTPYCGLQFLKINWEARAHLESVAPTLVDWIRDTFGTIRCIRFVIFVNW